MKRLATGTLIAAATALSACSTVDGGDSGFSAYQLVPVRRVHVGDGSLTVVAPQPWNRHRATLFSDIREVEDWTLNGPILDSMSFVTGVKSGRSLVRQRRKADQQVPNFRSDMTPPEIAAMVESLYRVRGGAVDFRTLELKPRPFLGANGFQLDYEHLDDDELWRKGRVVGCIINARLYMILLDASRAHYYAVTLPDFEAVVASARLG
ncbi:MAG: hypothetical protein ABIO80_03130 [Sphingomicrobium sp.]